MSNDKICFVICPIGDEGTDIREWSDLTFTYIIKPVVEQFGYKPIRANDIKQPGMITSQIIEQLIEAPLVIADLTNNNPNVFYELAVRHIVQKPYLQMIKIGQSIPFDVNGMRTIFFDTDLRQAETAKRELANQIKSIKNDEFKAINPITLAHTYKRLQDALEDDSSIREDNISHLVLESLNEVVYSISEIKRDVTSLKAQKKQSSKMTQQSSGGVQDILTEIQYLDEEISALFARINEIQISDKNIEIDSIEHQQREDYMSNLQNQVNTLLDRRNYLERMI